MKRKIIKKHLVLVLLFSICVIFTPYSAKAESTNSKVANTVQGAVVAQGLNQFVEHPAEAGAGAVIGGIIGFFIPIPGATVWGAGIGATIGGAIANSN